MVCDFIILIVMQIVTSFGFALLPFARMSLIQMLNIETLKL